MKLDLDGKNAAEVTKLLKAHGNGDMRIGIERYRKDAALSNGIVGTLVGTLSGTLIGWAVKDHFIPWVKGVYAEHQANLKLREELNKLDVKEMEVTGEPV